MREYSCSRKSARSSPSVASARDGDDVGTRRHHLAHERVAEVDDRLQQAPLLALDEPLLLRRLRRRCVASPVPSSVGRRPPAFSRSRRRPRSTGRACRSAGAGSGRRNRTTAAGARGAFSGSRRTMRSGSRCSKSRMNAATNSSSIPIERKALGAGEDGEHDRGEREDQAEQQPHRHEQQDRDRRGRTRGDRRGRCARPSAAATAASAR